MRSLRLPKTSNLYWYTKIAYSKRDKQLYKAEFGFIKSRYDYFKKNIQNIHLMTTVVTDDKNSLFRDLYCDIIAFSELEFKIRNEFNGIIDRCPYCGIDTASTLEHVLPKSLFSEYSIMVYNLIPCCGTCNSKKQSKIKEVDNSPSFLYLYNHKINDIIIFSCDIIKGRHSMQAKFKIVTNDVNIINHVSNLELIKRYNYKAINELSSWIYKIKNMIKGGKNILDILNSISIEVKSIERIYTRNNWRAVLLTGLINYISNKGLVF